MKCRGVKEIRTSLGLTQEELAQRLGVNIRSVMRWEKASTLPCGSGLMALNALQRRASMNQAARLRIGLCPDFIDTSLPLLSQLIDFLDLDLPPIQFVPISWDDRCLTAIGTGLIQMVLYNDYSAMRFQEQTGNGLARIGGDMESGSFYTVLYLPESYRLRFGEHLTAALLDLLWQPQTLKIIPLADMRANFLLFRRACVKQGMRAAKESLPDSWLTVTPAAGLSLLLQVIRLFPDQPVVYVGGQDQRVAIEQMNALEQQPRFRLLTDFSSLGWQQPRSLRLNCLFTQAGYRDTSLDNVWEAIQRVKNAMRLNSGLQDRGMFELRRWQSLHGSPPQHYEQHMKRLRQLSPEAKLWFP